MKETNGLVWCRVEKIVSHSWKPTRWMFRIMGGFEND